MKFNIGDLIIETHRITNQIWSIGFITQITKNEIIQDLVLTNTKGIVKNHSDPINSALPTDHPGFKYHLISKKCLNKKK